MNTKTIRSYVIVSFVSVCSYITQDFFFLSHLASEFPFSLLCHQMTLGIN